MSTVVNGVHRRVTQRGKVHPCVSVTLASSVSIPRHSTPLVSVTGSVDASGCAYLLSLSLAHPNEPENVTVDELDQVSAKISWKQSEDTVYHLECHHSAPCESYITYQPNQTFIRNSRFERHWWLLLGKYRSVSVFAFSASIRRPTIK